MASQALLTAAAALKGFPKKQKRMPRRSKPPSASPLDKLPADASALADLMPNNVRTILPALCRVPSCWSSLLNADALQRKPIPYTSSWMADVLCPTLAGMHLFYISPLNELFIFVWLQIDVGLKQLTCHFVGVGEPEHALEAFAELGELQLKGRKPLQKKPLRKRSQQPDLAPLHQPLYIFEGATGALQVS